MPQARQALRAFLGAWGTGGAACTAELLTTELVTNALVHTDQDAFLTVTLDAYTLRVEVRDLVPRVPRQRRPGPADVDGTSGRGLLLVRSLADAWGVRTQGPGKTVWFELTELPRLPGRGDGGG